MLANYGYSDGSGEFYITIDTDKCLECEKHPCLDSCPKDLFEIIEDDYEDMVAAIKDDQRRSLKYACADCKPVANRPELPCATACPDGGISHTW